MSIKIEAYWLFHLIQIGVCFLQYLDNSRFFQILFICFDIHESCIKNGVNFGTLRNLLKNQIAYRLYFNYKITIFWCISFWTFRIITYRYTSFVHPFKDLLELFHLFSDMIVISLIFYCSFIFSLPPSEAYLRRFLQLSPAKVSSFFC